MAVSSGSVTVTVHGLEDLRRKLRDKRADAPVARYLDRAAIKVQGDARKKAPVDEGTLRNSIGTESPSNRKRRIGPSVEYGEYVETGTRPHWPPPGALAGWARRHGMSEYAIRRKIGLYGTKKQPYMQPAAEDAIPFLQRQIPVLAAEIESAFQ